MIIRLDKIGDQPFVWQETLTADSRSLDRDELVELHPVACKGQVSVASSGFLFRAELAYDQVLSCVRCLEPITDRVESEVELTISVRAAEPTAGEHELTERELSQYFVEDEELDTRPILLEQLQLNIPMRKLCRPDCAGLCPSCGANRNASSCTCAEAAVDPRWEGLKAFSGPPEGG